MSDKFDLKLELAKRHLSKAQLSRLSGVSKATLGLIEENGVEKSHETTFRAIQDALLAYDKSGGLSMSEQGSAYKIDHSQDCPIIAMAQAGEAHDYSGIPVSWQETISVDIPKRVKVLGIKIIGDSMAPDYREGQIAIVTPEIRPVNGDLVIANIKKMGPVFKKFGFNGDPANPMITLTSINPSYQAIKLHENDFFWIWPVAEVRDVRRKF